MSARASRHEDLRRQLPMASLVLLGIVLSFYLGLGSVPLFDLDEGAFSEATREMLLRGDYISTFLNGAPRYDKPVLIYWLQAVSVLTLGVIPALYVFGSTVPITAQSMGPMLKEASSKRAFEP